MGIMDTLVPIAIICAACILIYVKVSYVRHFVAWVWAKFTAKKEEVVDKSRGSYNLAFRYD